MAEKVLQGAPASPGVVIGPAWRWGKLDGSADAAVAPEARAAEVERAHAALARAASSLLALAAELPGAEREIVEAGALMAADPGLLETVRATIEAGGLPAPAAILRGTGHFAEAIAAIGDETLAARADDVRSLGRRAARMAGGAEMSQPPGEELVLVAHDLGPADVAELASSLAAIALAGSAPTAHAAIVARSLGIPMVTGLPVHVLDALEGELVAVDGTNGTAVLEPSAERVAEAAEQMRERGLAHERAREQAAMPATTLDGRTITVLVNVAGAAELGAGLAAGAEGVGLLRTELAFLDAERWPSEQEHFDSVNSTLAGIAGRRAVVRVLDFGADKAPSFLHGIAERGIGLLLAHEEAFLAQLRAIIRCSREHEIELLLPMVEHAEEVLRTQQLLRRAAAEVGTTAPPLGCMIETPLAAASAAGIAAYSAFLSIGTNDLTASTLGADRFNGGAALTHDPRVLAQIDRAVVAAHAAGIPIEVCGEAASEPVMLPLLVGLGVDELSVGAAQVGVVRERIRGLSFAESSELARRALKLSSAEEVERSVDAILAAQVGL